MNFKNVVLLISLLINLFFIACCIYALNRYGGLRSFIKKLKKAGIEAHYTHRVDLFETLQMPDSAIVFVGNSITQGNEWAEMFANPRIVNRGINADHCDGIRARLDAIAQRKPHKIFLMAGINDLLYHPPDIVLKKYEALLDAIIEKAPQSKLYLQSVLPINENEFIAATTNKETRILNEGIKQLAKAKQLIFIDLYPLLLDKDGQLDTIYTHDGIHLNGKAYLKWKAEIEHYVLE